MAFELKPNPKYPYVGKDLNTIPYDAPLSFIDPSSSWVTSQTRKGAKGTFIPTPDPVDLTGKTIIISGGNNGIGREAALQFAAWGASTIVLACRTPPPHEAHPDDVARECMERAKAAGYVCACEWWELDMANLDSIEAFAARWLEKGDAIDILCNNAGIGSSPGGSAAFLTKDGFEIIHQVNFLSHVLLTLRLLPCIAKAPEPRIVCTTSCFHFPGRFDLGNWNGEKGQSGNEGVGYYQNNKLFFQTWLTELQHRLLAHEQYKHITINGVHPGYVNSGIWNLNSASGIKTAILKFAASFMGITPQQGSLAITNAATSLACGPDPSVQGVGVAGGKGGGRYMNRIWEDEPMPHTRDPDCRCRVWRKAAEELQLKKRGVLEILGE